MIFFFFNVNLRKICKELGFYMAWKERKLYLLHLATYDGQLLCLQWAACHRCHQNLGADILRFLISISLGSDP